MLGECYGHESFPVWTSTAERVTCMVNFNDPSISISLYSVRLGDPVALLPLMNHALLKFSRHVAKHIAQCGFEVSDCLTAHVDRASCDASSALTEGSNPAFHCFVDQHPRTPNAALWKD